MRDLRSASERSEITMGRRGLRLKFARLLRTSIEMICEMENVESSIFNIRLDFVIFVSATLFAKNEEAIISKKSDLYKNPTMLYTYFVKIFPPR
jgi:hypothetical protein